MADKYDEFLLALRELTLKHGIAIDGCGCCGSPYLVDADVADSRSAYAFTQGSTSGILWICPSDKYDWSHHSEKLIHPESIEHAAEGDEKDKGD